MGECRVNMPMFTVLRRFGIPITMGLEWVMLNSKPSGLVQVQSAPSTFPPFVVLAAHPHSLLHHASDTPPH